MKKIISLVLTFIMVFSLMVPAVYAVETNTPEKTPIIFLRGNGETIYYEDGKGEVAPCEIDQVLGDPSIYDVEGMKRK